MRPRGRRHTAYTAIVAMAAIGWAAPRGAFGQSRVMIDGGPDETGRLYNWTVTNRSTSPIVCVEFPHYRASIFTPPQGWTANSTNLVKLGAKDAPGVCRASTQPSGGIVRGASAVFSMQIAEAKAAPGRGVVRVRFADGSETSVADVLLATAPATVSKYIPLIGLGVIFVVAAVIRARRSRSRPAPGDAGDADDEPPADADVSR